MRATLALVLALTLALTGCKGDDAKKDVEKKAEKVKKEKVKKTDQAATPGDIPTGVEKPPAEPTTEPEKKPTTKPVLLETKALEMIPGSALMVGATTGIAPLAERIGWSELRLIKRDWYEMAVAAVVQFVGHNVLDFASLPEVGVDPEAPMGFAWLSWEDEAFAAWIRLTDPEKFKTTLYKLAGLARETLTPETMGDALILSMKGEGDVKIVLRGDYAFLVVSDEGDDEAMAHARRVATIDRAGSMAEVERFKKLMGTLGTGRDAAMYMDVATVLDRALGIEQKREMASESWVETELKNAKERGADAEEIARLEKQAEEDRAWKKSYEKRRKAEHALMKSFWGSLGAVAFGVELGTQAVTGRAIAATAGGMILEIFGRSEGRPLITKVVSGKPWLLAGATVDVASCRALFEKFLATEGTDWAEGEKEALEHLGVSLARDVLVLLDGQVGTYMGGEFLPGGDPADTFKEIEAGGYVGIKNQTGAIELLNKIAAHPSEVARLLKAVDGGWEFAVPDWRTVHVRVVDGYIAAGTDPAFLDRVAKGAGGDWPASMGNDDLTAMITNSEANVAWMMDMGLVGYMTFGFAMRDMGASAAVSTIGPDDAPYSQAWKDKKKAIEDEKKSIEEARKRLETKEMEVLKALFGAFGVTAAVGGPGPEGLQVQGGQYFGLDSIPAVGKEVANRAFEMEALSSRRNTEVWQRQDNIWRMENELQQIRQQDVEKYLLEKAAQEMKAPKDAAEAGRVNKGIVVETIGAVGDTTPD